MPLPTSGGEALPLSPERIRSVTPVSPVIAPLAARPEKDMEDTPEWAQFKVRVFKKTGIDLNLYKQQQMHRRLLNMVERANLKTFGEYFDLIEKDKHEFAIFLDRMTINVSELFRNPEKWTELREKLLAPMLTAKRSLKVWSAGCSYGAEPYTLAILLNQLAPNRGHTIHATDLDQNILAKARKGRFTAADVRNIAPAVLSANFAEDTKASIASPLADTTPRYQVDPRIRSQVTFRAHNLLADRFETGYDLICCRNVVIYFTDDAKNRLFEKFYEALAPGGIFFVGGTERIFNFREIGFTSPLPFFYQK